MDGRPFNRGALFNVGFKIAMSEANWTCIILHDVDLLPENPHLSYTCHDQKVNINNYVNVIHFLL